MKISIFFFFYMNCRENFFIPFLVFSGHVTVIINGLNYFKTGSAQSKQVKQPTKLIFLLKLGQLFLSLTQFSPSLLLNFLRNFWENTKNNLCMKMGENGLLRYWHFFLNFICIWFKLFHKLFLLLNMIISVSIALLVSRKYFISLHGLKITKLYTYRWNKNSYVKSNYRHGVFPWCFLLAAI